MPSAPTARRAAPLAAALVLAACQGQDSPTAPTPGRPAAAIVVGPPSAGPTVAPLALPGAPLALAAGGTVVPVSATFTDYAVDGTTATYQAVLDCGTGSATPVPVTTSSPNAGAVNAACTYTTPGVYAVSLTVTDGTGASSTQAPSTYVVVYDPGAGFVTGGGWIASPAGAFAANPSLAGRANFGFVAKYQKGATVPTGQTEFQFQLGGLNFHSTSYAWLVVSGSRAQYKGQGTVNGAAGYGFLLTAIDGKLAGTGQDGLRMKIWDASGAVVYDNQLGQSDAGSASTALAGGAITIHN